MGDRVIWFTADEHIGHKNIIKYSKRPYFDLTEMEVMLQVQHNSRVREDDDVYHVGDMFWRTYGVENAINYVRHLNGRHWYVLGNHEELMLESEELRKCFSGVYVRHEIYPEGAPKHGIVLDHYAGRVWHDSDKGNWQLYGHTHNVLPEIDPLLAMDVGVDANDYRPVSLDEVKSRMEEKVERIMRGLGVSTKTR